MTCKDCIYRAMCYQHEHYGYGEEYNEKPCEMFRNKADFVEVTRCKKCNYGEIDNVNFPDQYLCHYHGSDWNEGNHFCSYGERK